MKKILLMLGIIATVHFGAAAQGVGTGSPTGHNTDPTDNTGQQMRVVTGVKKNNTTTATTPNVRTHAYSSTTHKRSTHTTTRHKYAKTTGHKTMHHTTGNKVAVHHPVHKAHRPAYVKANTSGAYTGNRNMNTVSAAPPPAKKPTAQMNKDMKVPDYPGASNGGWDNGTNGRAGTNSVDGTLTPEKK